MPQRADKAAPDAAPAGGPLRPRRAAWPRVLPAAVVVLFAAGGVALGHYYWTGLRGSIATMEASIGAARQRQQQLAEQVRQAQAALDARAAELARREAELHAALPQQSATPDSPPAAAALPPIPAGGARPAYAQMPSVAAAVPPAFARPVPTAADWGRIRGRIQALSMEAARLPRVYPDTRRSGPRVAAGRLVRDQLDVAERAVALRDPALVEHAAAGAERLLADLYAGRDPYAASLARRLRQLRADLQQLPR